MLLVTVLFMEVKHFQGSCYLDDVTIKGVEDCSDLAPLHNPANLKGIYAMKTLLPDVPQVGVFDTSFHQTMPDYSFMYAFPIHFIKNMGSGGMGFMEQVTAMFQKEHVKF